MRVSLAKALKLKNKLTGQVRELQELLQFTNSYREGSVQKFDCNALMKELHEKLDKLAFIKSSIQYANGEVLSVLLVNLAEKKAYASWVKNLPTTEGKTVESRGYGEKSVEVTHYVTFDAKWVRDQVKKTEDEITDLQDQVDEYNASTTIEIK